MDSDGVDVVCVATPHHVHVAPVRKRFGSHGPTKCGDADGDGCDDCSSGTFDTDNDCDSDGGGGGATSDGCEPGSGNGRGGGPSMRIRAFFWSAVAPHRKVHLLDALR